MVGKEHAVSMEEIFTREAGETSSGITKDAQTYSISVETATLEELINSVVMEAGINNVIPSRAPKIQKVIYKQRNNRYFQESYEPRDVSLGPIHRDKGKYQLGEKYKLVLTYKFIKDSKENIESFYKMIGEKINELRHCFEEEDTKYYNDKDLISLLLVDGCAILQFIYYATNYQFKELNTNGLGFIEQDLFLLENQIPYRLLKWLMAWSGNEAKLKRSICNYIDGQVMVPIPEDRSSIFCCTCLSMLSRCLWRRRKHQEAESKNEEINCWSILVDGNRDPIHLLDLLRTRLLDKHQPYSKRKTQKTIDEDLPTYGNVMEFKAAGIHLKRSSNSCLSNISFSRRLLLFGHLYLPTIIVDDSTKSKFLNLMAYEACKDFENDFGVTSYIAFLDSLINDGNDVKELKKARVFQSFLPCDDEAAAIFNEIATDLVPNPDIYRNVRIQMNEHYKNTIMVWMAQFVFVYFSNPWTFFSLVGALLLFALTAIQTWYAIDSPCDDVCKNLIRNLTSKR